MRGWVAVALPWLVACGRIAFGELAPHGDGAPQSGDGAQSDMTFDAFVPPSRVQCGKPNVRVTTSGNARSPRLVANGGGFGLAWVDTAGTTRFRRMDATGAPVGGEVAISGAAGETAVPALAFAQDGYTILWAEGQNPSVRFARLDNAGVPVGQSLRVSPQATARVDAITLAFTGSQYGFTWIGDGVLSFGRFDLAGTVLGTAPITGSSLASPAGNLVWNGTSFELAHTINAVQGCPDNQWQIAVTAITEAGVVGAQQIVDSWAKLGFIVCGEHRSVRLAQAGAGYGIAFERDESQSIAGTFAILDATGAKQGSNLAIGPATRAPDVASSGTDFGVVWIDGAELVFARRGFGGTVVEPEFKVNDVAASVEAPAILWTGDSYALAWQDTRDGTGGEIYFALACP
jgi:hypothetical protein